MTPLLYQCEVCGQESEMLGSRWYVVLTEDGKRYLCSGGCLIAWAKGDKGGQTGGK